MERSLYITNFRNIGLNKSQRLVLNNFSDKDTMGNVVILVGPNNSGKSNVLDAIEEFGKRTFLERDVTTLSFDDNHISPQLSLCYKVSRDTEYTYRISYGNNEPFVSFPSEDLISGNFDISLNELFKVYYDLYNILVTTGKKLQQAYSNSNFVNGGYRNYSAVFSMVPEIEQLIEQVKNAMKKESKINTDLVGRGIDFVQKIVNTNDKDLKKCWIDFVREHTNNPFVLLCISKIEDTMDKINSVFNARYGIDFMPRIVRYADNGYNNTDLITDINQIRNNRFYQALCSIINYDIEKIKRVYDSYNRTHHGGAFATQEKEINKLLENIADDFNRMYRADDEKYRFAIRLETNKILFSIFNGEKDIVLDYQSTGFKWFFNLYFNLIGRQMLNCGDILLLDEPATNLHVLGQQELRAFLKDFAVKNGITIVLATHSPFLIDVDCLDELRIVESRQGEAQIHNEFSAISGNDADCLSAVKKALTVNSCQLYDPDKAVVFVEGITDYNYLLAFKKVLNISGNIVFLPINGVGNVKNTDIKDTQKKISKKLIELRKNNPILLVDGDKAGQAMKEINSQSSELTVLMLSDIDTKFKSIESLFAPEDLISLGLQNENGKFVKHASVSSIIKTNAEKYTFSEVTINNFKKLFDRIIKAVE